jgi:hypothetical protein
MMSEHLSHLSLADLELFVIDGLDAMRAAEIEAHLVACPACSAALASEARLEIAFEEVARAPVPVVRRRAAVPVSARAQARLGFAVVAAGTLSLAAAWMFLLMPVARTQQAEPSGYTATATDATTSALDGRNLDPLDGG